MSDARLNKYPELAPLTRSFAVHLASSILRTLPRPIGRPSKGAGDIVERTEQRLLEAMDQLTLLVREKRQDVYDIINPIVRSGEHLTNKWLLQMLNRYTPGEMMVYPQRLTEWRHAHLLLSNESGGLEPNSVSCMLIARMINLNRTGWLPRPPGLEAYWCWRQDAADLTPYPYEMPVVGVNEHRGSIKIVSLEKDTPSLLWSTWKGAAWDDKQQVWVTTESGAIRWVGEPTPEQLAHWLSPQQLGELMSGSVDQSGLARRALPILAPDRLSRHVTSRDQR